MRRITKISIDNYRAYIHPFDIEMPEGENLLIYGENGSGKSSLFKALKYFLQSSVDAKILFEINHFSRRADGKVEVTYTDFDTHTTQSYAVNSDAALTTNNEPFIKLSHRASGFLDYAQLLKVYLNNGKHPNLYGFIIDLLKDYVPVGFDSRTIGELIKNIEDRVHAAWHRTDYIYQHGYFDYQKFSNLFPQLIAQLNVQLKSMMSNYFSDMGLEIELVNAKVDLDDPWRIQDINLKGQVYIDVKHHGNPLPNYNDRLNEARLSAIATCLYLSSLKLIANTNDTRVLFLDDVFIGLDLGNRLPVLNIVKDEFADYQRIITTYDKSWYLQAKEVLDYDGGWSFYEMYEVETNDGAGKTLVEPLMVDVKTNYGKACSYFNCKDNPDYPAAANYLRKVYEELLQCRLYDKAVRDDNYETLAAYRLTNIVKAARAFVEQLHDYRVPQATTTKLLADLWSLLHPLLHPLSHFAPDVPVYKAELKKALDIYPTLKDQIRLSDYCKHCEVVFEKGNKIEFVVKGTSGWENRYVIKLNSHLYRYDNDAGGKSFSLCELRVKKLQGLDVMGKIFVQFINNKSDVGKAMVYNSLQDCHDKILNHIKTKEGKTDIETQSLEEMFMFPDAKNILHPLSYVLANPKEFSR